VERYVLARVAAVYVVSLESRDRCLGLGVPPDRLVIVGNAPELLTDMSRPVESPADIADLTRDGKDILLFVGILIADRGVLTAIRAMPALRERCPAAALVIVGDGPERWALGEEVRRMGLGAHVRLVGWKLHEELDAYYRSSKIGLLPFRDTPHVRLTLANKLFDYMGAALPVLGADLPPIRRVLLESQAGALHRPDDPRDLARAAAELLADAAGRQLMGICGRRAAETVYSWKNDAERLCGAAARLR
jgi:glycosyltransferase involved in cell wall biosynthesis